MSFVSTFDHTNPMTDSKLTASQLDQLKLNYAEMIVEGMDMDSLITFAVEREELTFSILYYFGFICNRFFILSSE